MITSLPTTLPVDQEYLPFYFAIAQEKGAINQEINYFDQNDDDISTAINELLNEQQQQQQQQQNLGIIYDSSPIISDYDPSSSPCYYYSPSPSDSSTLSCCDTNSIMSSPNIPADLIEFIEDENSAPLYIPQFHQHEDDQQQNLINTFAGTFNFILTPKSDDDNSNDNDDNGLSMFPYAIIPDQISLIDQFSNFQENNNNNNNNNELIIPTAAVAAITTATTATITKNDINMDDNNNNNNIGKDVNSKPRSSSISNASKNKTKAKSHHHRKSLPIDMIGCLHTMNLAPPRQSSSNSTRKSKASSPPFSCPYQDCTKTFTRQYNLKSHLRTHTDERPFVCGYEGCTRAFARQHDKKRHYNLHLGVKPHVCHHCRRAFARLDALNRHLRSDNGAPCAQATTLINHNDNNNNNQYAYTAKLSNNI